MSSEKSKRLSLCMSLFSLAQIIHCYNPTSVIYAINTCVSFPTFYLPFSKEKLSCFGGKKYNTLGFHVLLDFVCDDMVVNRALIFCAMGCGVKY